MVAPCVKRRRAAEAAAAEEKKPEAVTPQPVRDMPVPVSRPASKPRLLRKERKKKVEEK